MELFNWRFLNNEVWMVGLFWEEWNCLFGVVFIVKFRWLVYFGKNGIV